MSPRDGLGNELTQCWKSSPLTILESNQNPKDATRSLLELIKEFCKVAGYKINIQKSVVFLYT